MLPDGSPRSRPPRPRRSIDAVLVVAVLALLIVGLVAIYTASFRIGVASEKFQNDGGYFLKRQITWVALGLAAMTIMAAIDVRLWQRLAPWLLVGALAILLAILVFGELRFGGYRRWLAAEGSVQPSEAVKLAVIIYVAAWLAGKGKDIHDVTLGLLPFAMVVGTVCGLIVLQPDFSTAALIALVAATMFFTAGAEARQMLASAGLASAASALLVVVAPYRLDRVRSYLHPDQAPESLTFQVRESLAAIARGGVLGVGLGQGQEKHILPAPHTDTVFAVVGEESGLLGCLLVVGLLAVVTWRGLRIAAGCRNPFAAHIALGVTCWLCFQGIMNMAGVTALAPLSGVPLPLVSFGGSSTVACLAAIGLLLNISRSVDRPWGRIHADLAFGRWHRRSHLSRAYRARRLAE